MGIHPFLYDWIRDALAATDCSARELSPQEAEIVRSSAAARFGTPPSSKIDPAPLWQRLTDDFGYQNAEGWLEIEKVPDEGLFLFFDGIPSVYLFGEAKDIVRVLGECPDVNFYITDQTYTFLLAFNDHEFLIGCGRAKQWLLSGAFSDLDTS